MKKFIALFIIALPISSAAMENNQEQNKNDKPENAQTIVKSPDLLKLFYTTPCGNLLQNDDAIEVSSETKHCTHEKMDTFFKFFYWNNN